MLSSGCNVHECHVLLLERSDSIAPPFPLGNSDGVDPDSLAARDISYPEFRAPTFYIRISHSRMGEEDVSTSPVRHVRIL